jgi:hypothetical protein
MRATGAKRERVLQRPFEQREAVLQLAHALFDQRDGTGVSTVRRLGNRAFQRPLGLNGSFTNAGRI